MKRREFIYGSAIVGLTVASGSLLVRNSGMFHGRTQRKVYRDFELRPSECREHYPLCVLLLVIT